MMIFLVFHCLRSLDNKELKSLARTFLSTMKRFYRGIQHFHQCSHFHTRSAHALGQLVRPHECPHRCYYTVKEQFLKNYRWTSQQWNCRLTFYVLFLFDDSDPATKRSYVCTFASAWIIRKKYGSSRQAVPHGLAARFRGFAALCVRLNCLNRHMSYAGYKRASSLPQSTATSSHIWLVAKQ